MDRRWVIGVLGAVALALLLVSAATAREVHLWHAPPGGASVEPYEPPPETVPATTALPQGGESDTSQVALPAWVGAVARVLSIVAGAILLLWAARSMWRRRPRLRWRALEVDQAFEVLPDGARSMREDAADQRAVLMRGSPRNAIVECWLRLESVVAGAGMPRQPADTSTEFTARVLGAYAIDRSAILDLAALYREARFSTHEMGEAARTQAIAALDALHAALQSGLDDGLRAAEAVQA